MAYKNLVDLHVHTDNSFDGKHSAMYLCETAIEKGLRAVAFTDHIEIDGFYQGNFDRTAVQSYFEAAKARSAFNGKLMVCIGVELGQAIYDKPSAEKLLASMNYDFVLGAIHNLPGVTDFYYMDFSDESVNYMDMLARYFEFELQLAQWDKFDSLAHLTYPLRYIVGKYGGRVDMSKFSEIIDEILETLIKNGKALEINSSGLRGPLGVTLPDEGIIRRYKKLGGKLATIGSDAHDAEQIGEGVAQSYDLALKCGFDAVAVYQGRTPTMIPIK